MEEIKKIPQKTIAFILVMIFMIYVSQTVYAFPTISVDFSSGNYGYFIDSSGNVSIYTIYIKTLPAGYSSKLDYSGIKIPEVFSDTHVFAAWLMEQDGEEGVLVSNKTLQSYIDEEMELDDDVDFTAQYISQLSTSIDKSSTLTSITLTANTEMAYDDDFEDIDIDYSYIWYLDGEELDETSDTLKVAAGGTYTVEAVGTVTIAGTEISIPSIDIGSADVEYIDFSDAEVIVSADNESPKTGQEVILTAKISPEYDGAEYTYEWYCADAGTEISFSADMPLTVSNDWTLIGGTESITVEVTEEETLYFCVVLMNGGENILYKYSDAYSVSGAKTEDTNDENTENGNTNNEEYTEENESTDNEENIEENEDTNDIENTKKNEDTDDIENIEEDTNDIESTKETEDKGENTNNTEEDENTDGIEDNEDEKADNENDDGSFNIVISKVDSWGNYIDGATLEILDENGENITFRVVSEMETAEENVEVGDDNSTTLYFANMTKVETEDESITVALDAGNYSLHEVSTPEDSGYVLADDIDFTIDEDGNVIVNGKVVSEVTMVDELNSLTVSAVDYEGIIIEDVTITIYDENGNVVEQWLTTASKYTVSGLTQGTYTVVESSMPDSYVEADEVTFIVNEDGTITVNGTTSADAEITLTSDKTYQIFIQKFFYNEDGSRTALAGATLDLTDIEGNVIEEWTSTLYKKMVWLPEGEYNIEEVSVPDGYLAADVINFTVSDDGTITLVDGSGLLLQSTSTICVIDQVDDDPKTVTVEKLGLDDEYVSGAVLQVLDEDGDSVKKWTTDGDADTFTLTPGDYTLHEVSAPEGYLVADDIEFTVNTDGTIDTLEDSDVDSIVMYDKYTTVAVSKRDAETEDLLAGASLKILDEDGNVVYSWTSTESIKYIQAVLEAGETYILHETSAPDGYEVAEDIEFTIRESDSYLYVTMDDEPEEEEVIETGVLQVSKTVSGTGGNTNKKFGFIVTFLCDDGGVYTDSVYYIISNGAAGYVTPTAAGQVGFELKHNETITFYDLPEDTVYYVTELDYTEEGYTSSTSGLTSGAITSDSLAVVAFTNTFNSCNATCLTPAALSGGSSGGSDGTDTYSASASYSTNDTSNMPLYIVILIIGIVVFVGVEIYKNPTKKSR